MAEPRNDEVKRLVERYVELHSQSASYGIIVVSHPDDIPDLAAQVEQVLTGWRKYPEEKPEGTEDFPVPHAVIMEDYAEPQIMWHPVQDRGLNEWPSVKLFIPLPAPPTIQEKKG